MITIIIHFFSLIILFPGILNFSETGTVEATRIFNINNEEVSVTFDVDDMFYGLYQGDKSGYLLLKRDGTGEYKYDIFGVATSECNEGIIQFEWGFPLDKNNDKVKFKKLYGYSYPVIFKCSGDVCFQGCSKVYLLDFILDKGDGKLHVSSSDDWKKIR
jgi:hypothetical protein